MYLLEADSVWEALFVIFLPKGVQHFQKDHSLKYALLLKSFLIYKASLQRSCGINSHRLHCEKGPLKTEFLLKKQVMFFFSCKRKRFYCNISFRAGLWSCCFFLTEFSPSLCFIVTHHCKLYLWVGWPALAVCGITHWPKLIYKGLFWVLSPFLNVTLQWRSDGPYASVPRTSTCCQSRVSRQKRKDGFSV